MEQICSPFWSLDCSTRALRWFPPACWLTWLTLLFREGGINLRNDAGSQESGLFSWILNYKQDVVFIWCEHKFIFLGADLKEDEVILGVTFTSDDPSLQGEVGHEVGILGSGGILYGALNGNPSVFTTTIPCTPFWLWGCFSVSFTSAISDGWGSSTRAWLSTAVITQVHVPSHVHLFTWVDWWMQTFIWPIQDKCKIIVTHTKNFSYIFNFNYTN